ncbi:MAG TPA: sigma-70 family RNA polymerase sigma factor [Nitriliruptorales bacterium]
MLQTAPDGALRSAGRGVPSRAMTERGTGSDAARLDALLPGLRAHDRDAFHDLYDLMAGQLLAFCHGLVSDRGAAEDVVQDVFLRFSKHARRFRGDGRSLLAWLYTTARNRCSDRHRRRRRKPEQLVDTIPDDATASPAPELPGLDPELEDALAKLTEAQRAAIVLRRVVGYDGDEVGAVLGIDREAVYALCRRGEQRLRTLLTDPTPARASDAGSARRPES